MTAAFIGSCLIAPLQAATSLSYYDIDFDGAGNVPGQPIPTGFSGNTVSNIYFGDVRVGTFPATGSNAALFNTAGNGASFYYDYIELVTQTSYSIHHMSLDLLAQNLIGTNNMFSILFDTPRVQTVRFMSDGYVWVQNNTRTVPFLQNQNIHLELIADTAANSWDVRMNGISIYNGEYESDEGLVRSVRMGLGVVTSGDAPNHSTNVFVDNIVLVVPEPSAAGLLGLGLLGMWRRRR